MNILIQIMYKISLDFTHVKTTGMKCSLPVEYKQWHPSIKMMSQDHHLLTTYHNKRQSDIILFRQQDKGIQITKIHDMPLHDGQCSAPSHTTITNLFGK